ncbi:MAG: YkgJ family cysteine cluster protein [Planctomycetota bacterium]|nr:YkgJ family cysteine cluster protein [Planctomycetota bacterium]
MPHRDPLSETPDQQREWFDEPDRETGEPGLRFGCTQCGNCCSGPPGFVLFTDTEADAIAARLGMSVPDFLERFTEDTSRGRSLIDIKTIHGYDCVFLDRSTVPGKAVCSIYEDRPEQCRTWPFWKEMLQSRDNWVRAKATCPGLDSGRHYTPVEIRVVRDGAPPGE